jgi:hypothetical protein
MIRKLVEFEVDFVQIGIILDRNKTKQAKQIPYQIDYSPQHYAFQNILILGGYIF